MTKLNQRQEQIIADFELFDDWMGKYQYLIDLGKKLPEFPAEWQQDQFLIRGCQSRVWLHIEQVDGKLSIRALSDSAIVCGLIYLLLYVYDNATPQEIIALEPDFIAKIGLDQYLSPTRKNGLSELLKSIKQAAHNYAVQT